MLDEQLHRTKDKKPKMKNRKYEKKWKFKASASGALN